MDEKILIKDIGDSNKWWIDDFKMPEYRDREMYSEIKKYMDKRQIVAITGLRRVGKTFVKIRLSQFNHQIFKF